jgi:hypothetical protein
MTSSWHDFLQTQNCNTTAAELQENALYPLSEQAFLRCEGPDAAKFLQGQLSCNIQLLSLTQAGIGSHSSPKGRMLSSFRIMQCGEHSYLLRVHQSIQQQALQALKKYIVFSKAEITFADDIVAFGLHGPQAQTQLATLLGEIPSASYQQHIQGQSLIVCTDTGQASFEIYSDAATAKALWQPLAEKLASFSDAQHRRLEIQLGLAFVELASYEQFTPQTFNYQLTTAVSFKKGCYTGQEIVARLHYLGKLKRQMYHYKLQSNVALNIADSIQLEADKNSAGDILSAVQTSANEWHVLLSLSEDAFAAEQLLHTQSSSTLQVLERYPLHYSNTTSE